MLHKPPATSNQGPSEQRDPRPNAQAGDHKRYTPAKRQTQRGTRVGREPARTEPKPPPSSQPFPELFLWLWDSSK